MKELLWAGIALLALLTMTLIVLGLRFGPVNKTALGVGNIFEDGLLFGIFALVFAPLYLAWMGGQAVWVRLYPPAPLPVDGDDPVWSRRINRQVVETAFLAVEHARIKRNPNLAKRFISQDLYKRLRRECNQADAERGNWQGMEVILKEIAFTNERIEKDHKLCYFTATVNGDLRLPGSNESPQEFAEQLEFARALPEVVDARWQLMTMSGLSD